MTLHGFELTGACKMSSTSSLVRSSLRRSPASCAEDLAYNSAGSGSSRREKLGLSCKLRPRRDRTEGALSNLDVLCELPPGLQDSLDSQRSQICLAHRLHVPYLCCAISKFPSDCAAGRMRSPSCRTCCHPLPAMCPTMW